MMDFLIDPDEEKVICRCEYCDGEIYENDEVREIEPNTYIHDDCLRDWANEQFPLVQLSTKYCF